MWCNCPHCGGAINPASLLAQKTSPKRAAAARANGKKGGRPRKNALEEKEAERDRLTGGVR